VLIAVAERVEAVVEGAAGHRGGTGFGDDPGDFVTPKKLDFIVHVPDVVLQREWGMVT